MTIPLISQQDSCSIMNPAILLLISFFFWLSFGEWLSNRVFRAGLIGQIIVGLIYGLPIGGTILPVEWQQAFIALGYIGLIFIIFEGALAVRLDLRKASFGLSLIAAAIGVFVPVGLHMLSVIAQAGTVETFILEAALSVTSLGTTFVVLWKTSKEVNFSDTRVGTVLASAAVFDDVSGLVMASLTPVLNKYAVAPLYRKLVEPRLPKTRKRHLINVIIMILILCSFLRAFLTYLPTKHPSGPFVVPSREEAEEAEAQLMRRYSIRGELGICPTLMHTFEKYFLDVVKYLLQPLFFASIGFAIPFMDLWTAEAFWKGPIYTILMLVGKVVVGLVIPVAAINRRPPGTSIREYFIESFWPAILLGSAMVACGEIGLLIVQLGLNNKPYLSREAFVTAVWAIVLNTILGPVTIGFIVK
ncbi:hypothetical protein BCR34DRAFT_625723 [Clohesyomyces aquaticus]|uniref:Cation/H+ exchanger transmembrane domain-containing protein n=1 Tax=Clohesyomyces aquaticus TaxID=1231657 RepID=A0A1Y1ZGW1_9PLEO|nr:hypothetical protein BCR34DRAFT_625723 [Clohesyomyces aquaticus]